MTVVEVVEVLVAMMVLVVFVMRLLTPGSGCDVPWRGMGAIASMTALSVLPSLSYILRMIANICLGSIRLDSARLDSKCYPQTPAPTQAPERAPYSVCANCYTDAKTGMYICPTCIPVGPDSRPTPAPTNEGPPFKTQA